MKTIYLKKRIECRFGVSLFPNKPYSATHRPQDGCYMVQVSPVVFVAVRPNKIKTVQ